MSNAALETAIEAAWETRDTITPATRGETWLLYTSPSPRD